ncbi:hypothetical protein [Streptomyces sp. GC420]|uniref:hypothetical protein n=1 Tax=Streptomyces sp. GC420 TaxID=2697568 RepID=UPI001414EF45|nr:hypothetical protein [Streptomyces sp. GC420]NBM19646.1 hypothetical protein [Streptomyces sp. GC420]
MTETEQLPAPVETHVRINPPRGRGGRSRRRRGPLPLADRQCARAARGGHGAGTAALLAEPRPGIPDKISYAGADAPGGARWLAEWLDGTAWFCDEDGEQDLDRPAPGAGLTPWPEYRART